MTILRTEKQKKHEDQKRGLSPFAEARKGRGSGGDDYEFR